MKQNRHMMVGNTDRKVFDERVECVINRMKRELGGGFISSRRNYRELELTVRVSADAFELACAIAKEMEVDVPSPLGMYTYDEYFYIFVTKKNP